MNCTPAYVTVLTANADRIFSVSHANLTTPHGEYQQFMVTSTLYYLDANPRLYIEASNTDGLTQDGFETLAQVNEFIENHGGPRFERSSVAVHGVCTDTGTGNMHIKGLNAAMIIQARLAGKVYPGLVFENGLGEWLPDTGDDYAVVRSPGDVPIRTELIDSSTGLPFTRGDFKDIWLRALVDFCEGGV
jgi:hypothetical protein